MDVVGKMNGTRLYEIEWDDNFPMRIAKIPGAYGKPFGRGWLCATPNGLLGNLGSHNVTEHADGTITVSPSILVTQGAAGPSWHGYLVRGVWSEC